MAGLEFIDTHTHLDFQQFHRQHQEVIKRAQKAGVLRMINVGSSLSGAQHSVELASKYPEIYAAVGIHPHEVTGHLGGEEMKKVLELGRQPKVVAIGEIGLDYKDLANPQLKEFQKKFFKIQIGIAKQLKLPLIIHCREAFDDLYEILSKQDHQLKGVFHSFSFDQKKAQKVLDLGFHLSFTANLGYPANENLRKVASFCPLERILLETDAPFLPPQSKRGQLNEPAYVVEVAKIIAQIKKLSLEEVAFQTTQNARQLFQIG